MKKETGRVGCSRCGTAMYGIVEKRADVDGSYYCARCAEELGKRYLLENVCSGCNRAIGGRDAKFVMPSSTFGVMRMPISKRLLCTDCYKRLATRNTSRARSPVSVARRMGMVRSKLVESMQF